MSTLKKIRFGVLGYSRIAKKSALPALIASDRAELVIIGSRERETAQRCAEQFGCKTYGGYEDVLDHPDIDAVYISLPNALHTEWAIKAAEAGKHVWCEKPGALSFAAAKSMVETSRRRSVRLMEGFTFLSHPQHAKVRGTIASGAIGDPLEFDGCFAFPFPDENSSLLNPALGGGSLNDSAVYPIRASRMLFGEPESALCVLTADDAHGIDRKVDMMLTYSGGRSAHITSAFGSYFQSTYSVLGSRGRITATRAYAVPKDKETILLLDTNDTITQIVIPPADQFRLMIDEFCAELAAGADGKRSYEDDLLAQSRILDAARKSSAEKRAVPLSEIT